MRPLFVSSTGSFAGQTLLAWHLMRRLADRGLSPGFYKPLGYTDEATGVDPDAALFSRLFALAEPPAALCPFTLQGYREHALEFTEDRFLAQVKERYAEIGPGHGAFVVMGSADIFFEPEFMGLPDHRFIELLDAKVVLVDRYVSESNTVYSALSVGSFLGERLRAIVINRVPPDVEARLREKVSPLARARAGTQIVIVPEDRVLAANPVAHYAALLGGRVLAAPDRLDNLVAETTIGSAPLGGPLRLLKRVFNKVVLLGGTAAQLADPAFQPVPCGVLVTSGRLPPDAVVQACRAADVPLVAVPLDSFAILDRLARQRFDLSPAHAFKVERLAALLEGRLDVDRLLAD